MRARQERQLVKSKNYVSTWREPCLFNSWETSGVCQLYDPSKKHRYAGIFIHTYSSRIAILPARFPSVHSFSTPSEIITMPMRVQRIYEYPGIAEISVIYILTGLLYVYSSLVHISTIFFANPYLSGRDLYVHTGINYGARRWEEASLLVVESPTQHFEFLLRANRVRSRFRWSLGLFHLVCSHLAARRTPNCSLIRYSVRHRATHSRSRYRSTLISIFITTQNIFMKYLVILINNKLASLGLHSFILVSYGLARHRACYQ